FATLWQTGKRFEQYADGVKAMIGELAKSFRSDSVRILLAHVFLTGAVVGPDSGERPLQVGDLYAVNPQAIPPEVQYAALGHVHNPSQPKQFELANAYYSGSLLQVDFGEAEQKKQVNIVDVAPGQRARVQHLPLSSIRQLRNLGTAKEGLTLEQLKAAAASVGDAYLKVFLKADRAVPGLGQQVRDILPNALDVVMQYAGSDEAPADFDLQRESPAEMFTSYYLHSHSTEPPPPLMALFNQLHEEVAGAPH